MAKSLEELTVWWGDGPQQSGGMPDKLAKRLVLYAPEVGAWKYISDNWTQVAHYLTALDGGIREADYKQILDMLVGS